MNYNKFKNSIMIAVDFGDCSLAEIEESCQDWYCAFKEGDYRNIILFCKEQIPTDRDNSSLFLSDRGIAILEIMYKLDNLGPRDIFPVFGSNSFKI